MWPKINELTNVKTFNLFTSGTIICLLFAFNSVAVRSNNQNVYSVFVQFLFSFCHHFYPQNWKKFGNLCS